MDESRKTRVLASDAEACAPRRDGVAGPPRSVRIARFVPVALLGAVVAVAAVKGWFGLLTLENIAMAHEHWRILLQEQLPLALLAYTAVYVLVGAFCVPGGAFLTAAGGMAFGLVLGSIATVVGATVGAVILFLSTRPACGDLMTRAQAGWVRSLRKGFERNALSYLLFLRLLPLFPFWFVNIAAALLGVPTRIFVIGTFFGIMPATIAFAAAGAGLSSVIATAKASYQACLASGQGAACKLHIPATALLTKELVLALALLGLLSLLPVAVERWRRAHVGA